MGTANNIAKTLGITGELSDIIRSWSKNKIKFFDIGKIEGLEESKVFLEGFGYGVFPMLIDEMRRQNKESIQDPAEKMQTALSLLYEIVQSYKPVSCSLSIDGINFSGKYLLAEVMNIRSIGPNLNLAPLADPGDGEFEIVLISEEDRNQFAQYLLSKRSGHEEVTFFKTIKAKSFELLWDGTSIHIDDENIKLNKPLSVAVQMQKGALQFLVPH